MSFYQKYELERLIADGEIKTFRARESSTGRIVYLHLFNPEGKPLLGTLKSQLAKDPRVAPLIELGEFAGSPFAVTDPITPFTNLRAWLIAQGGTPPPAQPDAFTQLFGQPMHPDPPPPPQAPPAKPAEVSDEFTRLFGQAPPQPSQAKQPEPGEFTRMFGGAAAPKPQQADQPDEFTRMFGAGPAQRSTPQSAPPAPAGRSEPDDFEKIFGGNNSTPAAPPPVRKENPLPPGASPNFDATLPTGKFTQFFGSGPSGESINIEEEQARAARKATPESRPFQAPGEFTRVFGPQAGRTPGAAPPPPLPPSSMGQALGGSASGLFSVPAAPAGVRPKTATGPGEYTQMLKAPKLDMDRNAPDPLPPPSSSKRGLMIGLAIGIPVLIMIVYLVVSTMIRH